MVAGERLFVFDAGSGSVRNIGKLDFVHGRIEAVFVTPFHSNAKVPASGFGSSAQPFQLGPEGRVVVLKDDDLQIDAFLVDHAPIHPAVGYRIFQGPIRVGADGDFFSLLPGSTQVDVSRRFGGAPCATALAAKPHDDSPAAPPAARRDHFGPAAPGNCRCSVTLALPLLLS